MPDTSNEAIGRRLIAVREARGLHSSAMARMMDMSTQRWGGYERGRNVPPPMVLARFWQLTGATSDYILFGVIAGLPMDLAQRLQASQPSSDARPVAS